MLRAHKGNSARKWNGRKNVGKFACDTVNCGYRSRFRVSVRDHCFKLGHASSSAFSHTGTAKTGTLTEAESNIESAPEHGEEVNKTPDKLATVGEAEDGQTIKSEVLSDSDKESEDDNIEFSQVVVKVDNPSALSHGTEDTQNLGEISHISNI